MTPQQNEQQSCWLCHKPIKGRVYYQGGSKAHPSHKGCLVNPAPEEDNQQYEPSMWTLRGEVWNLLTRAKNQQYRDAINDVLAIPIWEQCAAIALRKSLACTANRKEEK